MNSFDGGENLGLTLGVQEFPCLLQVRESRPLEWLLGRLAPTGVRREQAVGPRWEAQGGRRSSLRGLACWCRHRFALRRDPCSAATNSVSLQPDEGHVGARVLEPDCGADPGSALGGSVS